MHNNETNLGAVVKAARKKKNLTQLEVSEELDITPRHLQAIENENKTPSFDLLRRMFTYLDIPADTVLASAPATLSPDQEQLIYLIKCKCTPKDISVLLSTAHALVDTKN